jgi:hypothetical protein
MNAIAAPGDGNSDHQWIQSPRNTASDQAFESSRHFCHALAAMQAIYVKYSTSAFSMSLESIWR